MSEQDETAPVENEAPVATEAAPAENGAPAAAPDDGFEKRYNDLRSEFNSRNNLIDRVRQGDAEAARELGLSFAEAEDPDQGDEEEPVFQDPRVDQLLAQQAQQQEQAVLNDVSGHIDTLLDEAQINVPQRFKNAILSEAWLQGGGAQITPEVTAKVVKEWVDEYQALEKSAGERYVKSKRTTGSSVSKVGTGANERPYREDMSLDERIEAAQEQARLRSE